MVEKEKSVEFHLFNVPILKCIDVQIEYEQKIMIMCLKMVMLEILKLK